MTRAFIGLGSNQGDSHELLDRALAELAELPRSVLVRCSPRYWTAPVGDADQPEFLNAVAELDTALEPLELLGRMQRIENDLGRARDPDRRWGPRTIDLDLLLFGHAVIRHADLVVPHPRMARRAFVLKPLADLVPRLEVPGLARVVELLDALDAGGVRCAQPDASEKGA
ncbi:MAG: 2-amino-4-hydroxy-6-hydroxymethyldihydropteridine diphosphokinase [Xanthomonadales bacterium]|nr:2-amino-4-hydroxy-6-hydroxymethyldihydropteridine diphosphokinase [Xanthomonadales bacterium]